MKARPKIYIDAGHGGHDPGAVNRSLSLREADVTFEVCRLLADMIGHTCDTMLSRPAKNTNKSIDQRIQEANNWGADYYLSVHVNAGGGTGAETFYFRSNSERSRQSAAFAKVINDTYANIMGLRNRGVKPDTQTFLGAIGVLRRPNMPSALVELAFLDAPSSAPDIDILINNHLKMAYALQMGISKHLGLSMSKPLEIDASKYLEIDLDQNTLVDEENGYFPISEINIIRMVNAGTINSPDYWRNITNIERLNGLMAKAYYKNTLDPRINNGITDIDTAFDVLQDAGVMDRDDVNYWKGLLLSNSSVCIDNKGNDTGQNTNVSRYLSQLIINIANRSRNILERIVMAEAGGEDEKGQILVANVVINRHNSCRFPIGIHDVVFQAGINSQGEYVYQFSPIGNGAYARAIPSQSVKQAVTAALDGIDHSRGALFFRSTRGLEGSWHDTALTHLFTHGGHAFFNPSDLARNAFDYCA